MAKSKHNSLIENSVLRSFVLTIVGIINPIERLLSDASDNNAVLAQIVPDQTLGAENSAINSNIEIEGIPSNQIEGGAIRGANLFHSFEQFNVEDGQGAYFSNPVGVERILGRVTGNDISQILGKLGVLGDADLFLINPNGIVFGSNAALDLNGSFIASTANSLIFEDGIQFNATEASAPPLLAVNIPIGLQFGALPGNILNQSQVRSTTFETGLEVQPENTLALVGGDVIMRGGSIAAPRGRIELGSVDGSGKVGLQKEDLGWALSYEDIQNFKDIKLFQALSDDQLSFARPFLSTVDFDGEGGGNIQLQGRNVTLTNGSQIAGAGANLVVSASETVEVSGIVSTVPLNTGVPIPSAIVSVSPLSGQKGRVEIDTKKLLVQNGGRISSEASGFFIGEEVTTSSVPGGNLIINASELVNLKGNADLPTGLFSNTKGFGSAGNIAINTKKLLVRDRATISVESAGENLSGQPIETGQAGNISIVVSESLELNNGLITAETIARESQETGANINLEISDLLTLRNQSQISATANGLADGGNIELDADFVVAFPNQNNDIIARAALGTGGNIDIVTNSILGIEQRSSTPTNNTNDIDPSSEFGFDGTVDIEELDVNPAEGLSEFPVELIDVTGLVAQNLCQQGQGSEFIVTGKGGIAPSPIQTRDGEVGEVGLVEPAILRKAEEAQETEEAGGEIAEAQGWIINDRGILELVAHKTNTNGSPSQPKDLKVCHASLNSK